LHRCGVRRLLAVRCSERAKEPPRPGRMKRKIATSAIRYQLQNRRLQRSSKSEKKSRATVMDSVRTGKTVSGAASMRERGHREMSGRCQQRAARRLGEQQQTLWSAGVGCRRRGGGGEGGCEEKERKGEKTSAEDVDVDARERRGNSGQRIEGSVEGKKALGSASALLRAWAGMGWAGHGLGMGWRTRAAIANAPARAKAAGMNLAH
jgi:hypothetical protein